MQTPLQPGQTGQQRPMWLRALALLCLMLVCFASTVQVCHIHGELAPLSSDSDSRQAVPDHCPLCVAMHSAMPAASHVAPDPVLQVHAVLPKAIAIQRIQRWHYELFSRPPPGMPSRA
ncbi:hypothetical protein [Granulicella sp. dw_53]|uniref:hypothetical protein n=1 Tax=Granulicella sp. dw_53 TaxID=2719792 RepID=UPI001BD2E0E5|nr:hypothetical protein [Granulicella sp. dw_53]